MKAMVFTKYGSPDVLQLKEVEKPTPKDNEVLVKIQAASVNAGDWHLLRGKPFPFRFAGIGVLKPKYQIPGSDIAGRTEAVGKSVTRFQPGDEVFGAVSVCGWGGFAEYIAVPENVLVSKPANLSFEQAAAVPEAAQAALQGLRNKGQLQPGQTVLINGASGGVGTFAVQLAKVFGAKVTAVCSTRNVEAIRSLGADQVIDYTKEDFTQQGQGYDLIIAANGYRSIWDYKRMLNPKGTYVTTGGTTAQMFQGMLLGLWISRFSSKKMGNLLSKPNIQDLASLKGLLETGKIIPVIDRCYPLEEVPAAIRYIEEGHARGKVLINLQ